MQVDLEFIRDTLIECSYGVPVTFKLVAVSLVISTPLALFDGYRQSASKDAAQQDPADLYLLCPLDPSHRPHLPSVPQPAYHHQCHHKKHLSGVQHL